MAQEQHSFVFKPRGKLIVKSHQRSQKIAITRSAFYRVVRIHLASFKPAY